jgi:hypothetical protein
LIGGDRMSKAGDDEDSEDGGIEIEDVKSY